jgi:hypothetical protein
MNRLLVCSSLAALYLCAGVSFLITPNDASAATIFESGTLGPTGVTFTDLTNGTVPGTSVNSFVFTGVRFELTQPVLTSQVGGHFVREAAGTFFGAIVALDNANDFPNSGDLSTPDVLGAATLSFPNPSAEVFGNLALSLDPGWYALVFGSGLFGTAGSGAALRNGQDIGTPTYVAYQPNSGVTWIDITPIARNHRFVVQGTIVPEPNALGLISILLVVFLRLRRK